MKKEHCGCNGTTCSKGDKCCKVTRYCQDCRYQTNHPSYCKVRNTYTPRKGSCQYWEKRK